MKVPVSCQPAIGLWNQADFPAAFGSIVKAFIADVDAAAKLTPFASARSMAT